MNAAGLGTLTLHPEAAWRLRHALLSNGYGEDALAAPLQLRRFAAGSGPAIDWREIAGDDAPLTALVELFVLGRPVDVARAADALAPLSIEDALRAGFVEARGEQLVSPWEVMVHDGLLLLGDHPDRMHPGNADFVGTVSNSARTLALQTSRAPVGETLDLGSGSGIQALLAARHSGRVVGVDVNPRAATIGRVNAYLNEVGNTDWGIGDWFDAVAAERRFDLVVANLPFVAAPDVVYRFAHSGLDPNELSRRIVRAAVGRLADGGTAQILTAWTRRRDEGRIAAVEELLAGTGCDAIVLAHSSEEATAYAAQQCAWMEPRDRARYGELLGGWLRHYREAGVEVVEHGLLSLRENTSGRAPFLHAIDAPRMPAAARGAHVDALFAGNAAVAALRGDGELLAGRFALADGHRVTQASRREEHGYVQEHTAIDLDPDAGYTAAVSVLATAVLFSMHPSETLGQTVARVAAESGIDEALLRAEAVAAVRDLLGAGMATPQIV